MNKELTKNINGIASDVSKLSELKIEIIHKKIMKENESLIDQIKENLASDKISEKQKWYGEQILKNLSKNQP